MIRAVADHLREHRWPWALLLAALLVRLHWNLVVHPLEDFILSDMRGYALRAEGLFEEPEWTARERLGFYPYGTHVLIYVVQRYLGQGPTDYTSVAVAYAVLGTVVVVFGYLLARQVSPHRIVAPLVGLLLVVYYPLISLGGYVLSEVPFSACLVSSTFFGVRMAARGRRRDAWAAGSLAALGYVIRPQLLVSLGLLGVLWLPARRRLPRLRTTLMLQALLPLLLLGAFSAWRLHFHTGRHGLVAENGSFNLVFGRCHNRKLYVAPDSPTGRRKGFGRPPLVQLSRREAAMPDAWPGLDPAREVEITFEGSIGDARLHRELVEDCIARTGWAKQLEYSAVNVLVLWRYNVMWPDWGKRSPWHPYTRNWELIHMKVLAIPALAAVLWVLVRRRVDGLAFVALHVVAIIIIATIFVGSVRLRVPYDPFIIILAIQAYAAGSTAGWRFIRRHVTKTLP